MIRTCDECIHCGQLSNDTYVCGLHNTVVDNDHECEFWIYRKDRAWRAKFRRALEGLPPQIKRHRWEPTRFGDGEHSDTPVRWKCKDCPCVKRLKPHRRAEYLLPKAGNKRRGGWDRYFHAPDCCAE